MVTWRPFGNSLGILWEHLENILWRSFGNVLGTFFCGPLKNPLGTLFGDLWVDTLWEHSGDALWGSRGESLGTPWGHSWGTLWDTLWGPFGDTLGTLFGHLLGRLFGDPSGNPWEHSLGNPLGTHWGPPCVAGATGAPRSHHPQQNVPNIQSWEHPDLTHSPER